MAIGSMWGAGKEIVSKRVGKGTISTENKETKMHEEKEGDSRQAQLCVFVVLLFRTGTCCRTYHHGVIKALVLLFFSNYKA